jgi:hypothetical protein
VGTRSAMFPPGTLRPTAGPAARPQMAEADVPPPAVAAAEGVQTCRSVLAASERAGLTQGAAGQTAPKAAILSRATSGAAD